MFLASLFCLSANFFVSYILDEIRDGCIDFFSWFCKWALHLGMTQSYFISSLCKIWYRWHFSIKGLMRLVDLASEVRQSRLLLYNFFRLSLFSGSFLQISPELFTLLLNYADSTSCFSSWWNWNAGLWSVLNWFCFCK